MELAAIFNFFLKKKKKGLSSDDPDVILKGERLVKDFCAEK